MPIPATYDAQDPQHAFIETHARRPRPEVRRIGGADLKMALAHGVDDFLAKPSHLLFLGILYPVIGLLLARATFGYDLVPLLYPLTAGFALVGPFAAVGLYEISRRRELGEEVAWRHALAVFRSAGIGAILTLGAVLFAIFLAWIWTAHTLYWTAFPEGGHAGLGALAHDLVATRAGWALIAVGNGAGLLFAVAAFAISVVSFPIILDRHVDAATAVETSLRAVGRNPGPMALWAILVAGALALGSLPFFIGLALAVPVLGHATWHLYRRVVGPDGTRGRQQAGDGPRSGTGAA